MSDDIANMIEKGKNLVPSYMWNGVVNYFVNKVPPGDFLYSLLCNAPVMDVMAKADDVNSRQIHEWCVFLYNYAPSIAWGSVEKVEAWLRNNN